MAKIGYARVSTLDQHPENQTAALQAAGCERVFTDHGVSGARQDRPELARCLAYLRPGEQLVVWRLDRLGRSVSHLVQVIDELRERGIEFVSLTESIDTGTAAGKLIFHVFAALAEFERELIRERTLAGLARAKAQGRVGGRKTVMTPERMRVATAMLGEGRPVSEIARVLGVGRASLYRALPLSPAPSRASLRPLPSGSRTRDNGVVKPGPGRQPTAASPSLIPAVTAEGAARP